jgi:hypothetical protein
MLQTFGGLFSALYVFISYSAYKHFILHDLPSRLNSLSLEAQKGEFGGSNRPVWSLKSMSLEPPNALSCKSLLINLI